MISDEAKYGCHKVVCQHLKQISNIMREKLHCLMMLHWSAKFNHRSEQEALSFQECCFLFGKTCEEHVNRKRWHPFSFCSTADCGKGLKSFKDVILGTFTERNDEWGNQVRLCMEGAVSDLHAADAKYHRLLN
jgi:hypothetical protein